VKNADFQMSRNPICCSYVEYYPVKELETGRSNLDGHGMIFESKLVREEHSHQEVHIGRCWMGRTTGYCSCLV